MKDFYRLVDYEVSANIIPLIIICIGKIIFPIIFLRMALEDYSNIVKRFEAIYPSSGCIIIFIICFVGVMGLCIKSLYRDHYGSKGIYILMTLPVKREIVYLSRLMTFFLYFIALLASELIAIFLGFIQVTSYIKKIGDEGEYLLTNGLFLSFVRSDFLRMILPLGIESFIYSISILVSVVCGLYYAVLCERSRRYGGFIIIAIGVLILIRGIAYPINHTVWLDEFRTKYIYSIPLLALSIIFIWRSINLVKRGGIT